MPNYLITAAPGTGKSAAIRELSRRGYTAYDTDFTDGASAYVIRATGEVVPHPGNPVDWTTYDFRWVPARIRELLTSDATVFLGAIVGNQAEFYPEFDKIFVLATDDSTLRKRILSRTDHNYGKHPEELAGILGRHKQRQAELLSAPRAIQVDATPPITAVVDQILEHITTSTRP